MQIEYMIPCPFCGQITAVEMAQGTPEEDRLEAVKYACRCTGARNWRTAQDAYAKIDRIAGAGAMENGFDYAESQRTVDVLKRAADDVIANKVRQIDMVTPGGDKYRVSMPQGEVKLKRVARRELML